jgi:hypothetical protein
VYNNTPEEDRLTVASFYMEGQALSWYQWMHRNNLITTWFGFLQPHQQHRRPSATLPFELFHFWLITGNTP